MAEAAGGPGLLLEALHRFRVGEGAGGKDLDGDLTPEAGVAGTIDRTHPSRPERRPNLVRAQARARSQRHDRGSP